MREPEPERISGSTMPSSCWARARTLERDDAGLELDDLAAPLVALLAHDRHLRLELVAPRLGQPALRGDDVGRVGDERGGEL